MKSITIQGQQRESVGKVATKALRNAGRVPCVVYGGETPVHFSADEIAFKDLVYTPEAHTVVVNLDNGSKVECILQDIQFHPVTDKILHIDFYQIFDDKEVTMEIPVRIVGNSKGVRNGGVLRIVNRKLRVKALPNDLPDFIEADITEMRIGNKMYVTAIEQEKFKIMHGENTVICQVRTSRTAVEDVEEEEEETEEGATEEAAVETPAAEAPAEE
ncbi:MAG TPA: 50S ribosomal protein L25/general stress protein Ctc [Flavobacteriaceae bacterium]|nr:50S ribosomal protein L25/general stress protein Ctc [Flavobacteriaceae bacterium]MCB9212175.1 50S ribosomal protein L25/general stress protein Ctc [Alteromonas sp.]HPF10447.1 50S ribosomal protein L25/general stress protein Ctc [Flavobacteriaceae bacterium]HQU21756.1 50S ribosomal protein L25/general stress protein Ctc [Flavobacteriaceae bacterium]HQU64658.1 50S ribosomal protein L25/general stress protein Ctc [Flavobacteriaceae bacterium]